MKTGTILICLMLFSLSASAETSCKEKWEKLNYPKNWKVLKAFQTATICGFVIKSKNQKLEEIISKQKGISILDAEHDFLGLCKVSYPNSDQMNCPMGTMKKISEVTGQSFKAVKF